MELEENNVSVEKIYFSSIFLNYYLDKIENTDKTNEM